VLLALASDDAEGEAGRLLSRLGLSHTGLRGAVVRGVDTASGEAREPKSSTPTLDEYSRDLTEMARGGESSIPSSDAPRRSKPPSRSSPDAPRPTLC
jgi:ATP-dependent Clp protease ATP-binding subunit ClpC